MTTPGITQLKSKDPINAKKKMKKTAFFNMVTLVVMGAVLSCCSKKDAAQPETNDSIVTITATIGLGEDNATKALTAAGVKTFAAGEQVAIRYQKKGDVNWYKAVSNPLTTGDISDGDKSATLTFTLVNPQENGHVYYVYPAAMADDTGSWDATKLNTQTGGTLASLAANYDLATGDGTMTGLQLPNVTLENQLAILAITLKNENGSADITSSIRSVTVEDYDHARSYTVTRTPAAGPIYLAILGVDNGEVRITATDGAKNYTKTLTGKTYEAGNGYNVSWRMGLLLTLTNPAVKQVIGNDGKNYAYASLPDGVTAVAMISYVSDGHGVAIAMADENNGKGMDWNEAMAAAAAHTPKFSGGTWKIPSRNEWLSMFRPRPGYANSYLYDQLNSDISSVGGTPLQKKAYWTSTAAESNTKYVMGFNDDSAMTVADGSRQGVTLSTLRVRSCLAF